MTIFEIFKYLVGKGVDIHVGKEAPFVIAASKGRLEIVKFLLEKGGRC